MNFLKEIIPPSKRKSDYDNVQVSISSLMADSAVAHYQAQLGMFTHDPAFDRDLLENIDAEYYLKEGDADFVCTEKLEMLKFSNTLDIEGMRKRSEELRKQQKAVSKRVSELVLHKHPSYAEELDRVRQLQLAVKEGFIISTQCRKHLSFALQYTNSTRVRVLACYRKQQRLKSLLSSLHTMKALQQTDVRLKELLEEENFAVAIQLCQDCQKAASNYKHFNCISQLSTKLQNMMGKIEKRLDEALSRISNGGFQYDLYDRIQAGYLLLGKSQSAFDLLRMHFTSTLHNSVFQIVLGFVQLCNATTMQTMHYQKQQYKQLCQQIPKDAFLPCLAAVCKAVWHIMRTFRSVINWHIANDVSSKDEGNGAEVRFQKTYLKQKVNEAPVKLWQDIEAKIRVLLTNVDLQIGFKFEHVIRILQIVNRLIQVGHEFCGATSVELHDSIRRQIQMYFRSYHFSRMDNIRLFLENEMWQPVPVKSSFCLLDLHEFRPFRHKLKHSIAQQKAGKHLQTSSPVRQPSPDTESSSQSSSTTYFDQSDLLDPFDFPVEENSVEDFFEADDILNGKDHDHGDVSSESGGSDDENLKAKYIDENTGKPVLSGRRHSARLKRRNSKSVDGPLVPNTLLEILRLFGKYIQIIHLLQPIAFDVVLRMAQMVEFYMYTVFWFFAREKTDIIVNSQSHKLKSALLRIGDHLIMHIKPTADTNSAPANLSDEKFLLASLSSSLKETGSVLLSERVVAVESVCYLCAQFETQLVTYLCELVPPEKKPFLSTFVSHTLQVARDLRAPAAATVAVHSLKLSNITQNIIEVSWDIQEILSEHSVYVDLLLAGLDKFKTLLDESGAVLPAGYLPSVWSNLLWEYAILLCAQCLVEGFSSAKRCSNEGRALMQLDFQQFLLKLEQLTSLRPIPHRELVDNYIKAYYLPEIQIESWLNLHSEYSLKQKLNLVASLTHLSRKSRQRIQTSLESPGAFHSPSP